MDSLIISLHGNVNNSKFIKKNIPLNFDQHPPPPPVFEPRSPGLVCMTHFLDLLKHNDVAAREEVV